jgi:hypothetical protein
MHDCSAYAESGSSLPYSQALPGQHFPAFHRYYEGAKTARLPSRTARCFTRCPIPPLTLAIRSQPRQSHRGCAGTLISRWRPFSGMLRRKSLALPCSQGTLMCLCPALRPRSRLHARPVAARRYCPPSHESEDPRPLCHFSGLYHTASALAVYASCRPRGRLRKTRFGAVANLSPVGFHHIVAIRHSADRYPQGSDRVSQF